MTAIGIFFDHATLVAIGDRFRVTMRDENGETIMGHWFNTRQEAAEKKAYLDGLGGFIPVQQNNWRQQGWR